jgi:rod shape determining protein RodA
MVGKEYDCSENKKAQDKTNTNKSVRKPDDYNVRQSKIAIGSGGFIGRGFLKGTQTRGKYVPEQHTDFIFTSLGEAFGFVGCLVFLLIYLFLLYRIIRIAERQRSTFSRVYAYSVASILFFHIAVNVCMTIGLFPIVGIPLPLISYGGSSLLTFTVLIFIMLRLDADRQMVLR